MTNPTAVFYWIEQDEAYGYNRADYPYFNLGVFMALSASFASGTAYLMMRIMGTALKDGINPLYFGTFSTYVSFIQMAIFKDALVEQYDMFTIFCLIIMSFFGFVA